MVVRGSLLEWLTPIDVTLGGHQITQSFVTTECPPASVPGSREAGALGPWKVDCLL